ncbi:MAG: hypothetical protein KKA64_00675 [Nanoarchaeota archaeon]|nr:hypothetical protein [Nanoarchaeota archaeon]
MQDKAPSNNSSREQELSELVKKIDDYLIEHFKTKEGFKLELIDNISVPILKLMCYNKTQFAVILNFAEDYATKGLINHCYNINPKFEPLAEKLRGNSPSKLMITDYEMQGKE